MVYVLHATLEEFGRVWKSFGPLEPIKATELDHPELASKLHATSDDTTFLDDDTWRKLGNIPKSRLQSCFIKSRGNYFKPIPHFRYGHFLILATTDGHVQLYAGGDEAFKRFNRAYVSRESIRDLKEWWHHDFHRFELMTEPCAKHSSSYKFVADCMKKQCDPYTYPKCDYCRSN